jgi:hypothetical protein
MITLILFLLIAPAQGSTPVRQPREVVEAVRVCNRFQQLFAEDLDFDRAFEATFTKDPARRRAIAIAEGDFGDIDVTNVDDASLISAYKSRMQILFLTLVLIDPDKSDKDLPDRINRIYDRGSPTAADFPEFTQQVKSDAADLRSYLNELVARDPKAAMRIRDFKTYLSKPLELPKHVVKPSTYYSNGRILGEKEQYYQISDYAVIREGGEMRIIGIRFFTLF